VSLALAPGLLTDLAGGSRSVLVSGTNGKTTTSHLLAVALGSLGPVAVNRGGNNMPAGLVAALGEGTASRSRLAVLEVDESHLNEVISAVRPEVVTLLNLSRDQLDRVSEVRRLAQRWRSALTGSQATVVANADDPLVAYAALSARRAVWVSAGQTWRADSSGCPICQGRIGFEAESWACDCGYSRPTPEWRLADHGPGSGSFTGPRGASGKLEIDLPGRFNLANALMALASAVEMGVAPETAAAALDGVGPVSGRYQTVTVGSSRARLLLAKNPAGFTEALGITSHGVSPVVVAINARTADGRDPSWLYDVPFEMLAGRRVVATGERWADLSVRLSYAGVDHESEPDPIAAIARASHRGSVTDVLANYTAFFDLNRALGIKW
jgi:UDP-N-acetylmuramyl tripeptide synthase